MRKLLAWMFAAVVLMGGVTAQDGPPQTPSAEVTIPINGRLAIVGNLPGTIVGRGGNQLFVVDTLDGSTDLITQHDLGIRSLVWSGDGNSLGFVSVPDIRRYNVSTEAIMVLPAPPDQIQDLQDWSLTGLEILNVAYDFSAPESGGRTTRLEIISAETGEVFQTLFTFSDETTVTDIPLPARVSNFLFTQIRLSRWNPVYPEWLLVQLDGYDDTKIDPISGYPTAFVVTLLYNLQTGEKLSVDALFEKRIGSTDIEWNDTGEFLLLQTLGHQEKTTDIVRFADIGGVWTLKHIKSAVSGYVVLADWLGIDDMLIMGAADGQDRVFYIAQIIDGSWHQTEYLRFPTDRFERVLYSAWHNEALPEQSYSISCLFDSAQPTRLAVGAAAQVNFTNGTPLRLRDAPDFGATEITQMAEGTAFDVIGGPACVNGDSYYRFWQVELAEGTIGWAAEADTTDYFIEPVEGQ